MSKDAWIIIWIAAAAAFGTGELLIAGSFFLFPFAIGALVAALVTAIFNVTAGWAAFAIASIAAFYALRPLARRLDRTAPDSRGIGANRLTGAAGVVVDPISANPGIGGLVKVGTEEWRANTVDGSAIGAGQRITVIEVQGTRLIVEADNSIDDSIKGS